MKLPITIEPLGKLVVLSWPTGKPPYTVSQAAAVTGPWSALVQTNDAFTIVQASQSQRFFTVEDSATGLAKDNHFILSRDGVTADVDITNPTEVVYPNSGYRSCYARNCPNLIGVNANSNRLSTMDFTGSTKVRSLKWANNQARQFPTGYEAMSELAAMECGNNWIDSISLIGKSKLAHLTAEDCQIPVFDTSPCPELATFKPYGNPFMALDFSNNRKLVAIDTGGSLNFSDQSFSDNLVLLDSFGMHNGVWECYGSHPVGAGIQAEKNLQAKGWRIQRTA